MLSKAVAAAVGPHAALVVATAASSTTDVIAALRAAGQGNTVVLLIEPGVAAIDRAMLLAALGPLAVALAPVRIAAVDVAEGAAEERVVAAASYLADAQSTTGQYLRVI